ncbi:MATE family efflux transporter [uncultured Desulfovibrio sp.]|uniref:MATE family efflux transporter n=3 Tax=uncultured Desulfovibrio sp. TaxID=167968 RepID=UPI0025EB6230|nr:MATE family efflux transporter [uncultured Desulfovibrio sp.]
MSAPAPEAAHAKSPLACAPLPGLIVSLALPAMLSQVITLGYNIVDRAYLGHTLEGVASITAVGICVPVTTLLLALVNLFARGGAPLGSISLGADDTETAERILGASLFWLVFCALVSTLALLFWAEPLLGLFGAGEATLAPAALYLRIYSLGNLVMMTGLGLNFFINAQGFTRVGMMTPLIGCTANILLDPVFIFALDMGVAGAAVATVIAQSLSLLWVLRFFRGPRCLIRIRRKFFTPGGSLAGRISLLGSAPAFMVGSEGILVLCFNLQMGRFGGEQAIASMTILSALFQVLLLPMVGIYQGAQPVVSYNYGSGNIGRVRRAIRLTGVALCVYSVLMTGLMAGFPAFFAGLFTDNEALVRATAPLLRIYISGGFLLGVTVVSQESYNALGHGRLALFFALFRKGILLIPLIYVLPALLDARIEAVVLAETISDITAALCSGVYFLVFLRKTFSGGAKAGPRIQGEHA